MDVGTRCALIAVSRVDDPALWGLVEGRARESLPDFDLVGVERVQNKDLWRNSLPSVRRWRAERLVPQRLARRRECQ